MSRCGLDLLPEYRARTEREKKAAPIDTEAASTVRPWTTSELQQYTKPLWGHAATGQDKTIH